MNAEPAPISDEARHALEQELEELRSERDRVASTLTDSDSTGDTADQAEELRRAADLELLDSRIDKVTMQLNVSTSGRQPRTGVVEMGSSVTVRFADETVQTVEIGEIAEELDRTLITTQSPLGHALIGHRVGDTVRYQAPHGETTAFIVAIEPA